MDASVCPTINKFTLLYYFCMHTAVLVFICWDHGPPQTESNDFLVGDVKHVWYCGTDLKLSCMVFICQHHPYVYVYYNTSIRIHRYIATFVTSILVSDL